VFENQYITAETLYKTYIREANAVVKSQCRHVKCRRAHQKKQKLSGTSRMFRGASALEPQESEMTEPVEFDPVIDEIRRWSSVSEDECQRFVCVENGVLNEFEMMWHLRILFPLNFFFFKKTVSHLAAEANVEQVFSQAGQLSEVNSDPDVLAVIVSIMINKHTYKTSVKDIMDKCYEMFRGKNRGNKADFFNRPEDVQDSDTLGWVNWTCVE
jgi:hypothetical protein